MRIPIFAADIEKKRVTNISRRLKKAWPSEVGLMQAQGIVAKAFGYRDMHDVHSSVPSASSATGGPYSRTQMRQSIAWRLWRNYELAPEKSRNIAECLPINQLEIDAVTLEREFEISRKQLVLDESYALFGGRWHPQSPVFIECGAPAYRFAVLSDGRVFRFRALEQAFDSLPADYLDDLANEVRYASIRHDQRQVLKSFIKDELIPLGVDDILTAVHRDDVMPKDVRIEGVFDSRGECIGRVLINDGIGGMYPKLFSVQGDDIFSAIALILRGEGVASACTAGKYPGGSSLYVARYGGAGSVKGEVAPTIEPEKLDHLPEGLRAVLRDGIVQLAGPTFVEQNQVFVRIRTWLHPKCIPQSVLDKIRVHHRLLDVAANGHSDSPDAVPAAASELYDAVSIGIRDMFEAADRRMASSAAVNQMIELIFLLMPPSRLNQYFAQVIDDNLPVHRQGSETLDDQSRTDYARERQEELDRLEADGSEISQLAPALSQIDRRVLGWILLGNAGEAPFGRHRWLVSAPADVMGSELAKYLAGFVFQVACGLGGRSNQYALASGRKGDALLTVMAQVMDGDVPLARMEQLLDEFDDLQGKLFSHTSTLMRIKAWREHEAEISRVRAAGELLYVGQPVPTSEPEDPLWKAFSAARSHRVKFQSITQSSSDMGLIVRKSD